jgi:hypothetical protein
VKGFEFVRLKESEDAQSALILKPKKPIRFFCVYSSRLRRADENLQGFLIYRGG